MQRLALVGDLHLDARSPRYRHTLEVLDFVIEDALAQHATAFALLGDLCEGAPDPEVHEALASRFVTMTDRGRDLYIVLGNHEHPETLRMFSHLDPEHVFLAWDRIEVARLPGDDPGDVVVLPVPYPRRGRPPFDNLDDDGTIPGSLKAAAARIARTVADAVQAQAAVYPARRRLVFAGEKVVEAVVPRDPLLVLGHFTVEGAATRDTTFEQHHQTECVVPVAAFAGAAGVFTGHIHAHSVIRETPPIVVVGAPVAHDFGETEPKGYVLVTIEDGAVSWEFRRTPARPMITLDLTWPLTAPLPEIPEGCETKVTIEIPEDRVASFDPSVFDPIRERAALFLLDKRTVSSQRVRAPELRETDSLAGQLARWGEALQVPIDVQRLAGKLAEVEE